MRPRLVREFDGWAPELTALITDSDTVPLIRPLFAQPRHRLDQRRADSVIRGPFGSGQWERAVSALPRLAGSGILSGAFPKR
ncbi:hypothetical protein [Fodinicola feengrottensis]|uniref:hypothetical protein n=1 Tax=Fodinicola feengrottensis TaxID=435914 RepID=UPI002442BE7D|nr:hypothetical protein [Fodinicola feengrottensis]